MPYLNSSTNHSPNQQSQPYTPTEPDMPTSAFSSQRNSAAPHHTIDPNHHRGSINFDDSRRGSVDSRMHQHMDSLRLNGPTSPYNQSANASQTSLASSLQQQRGIQNNGLRLSNGSIPASPHWSRNSITQRNPIAGRIAPPIMEHPRDRSQFAAEPTRGQPWAFPDPDESAPGSMISRRNSQASSFTNSIYSELNRPLPPGQHELPDHHHHTAMPPHDRVSSLKEDPDSPTSTTPYSRTPELRVTHKLAERKRRSEMKDCFEQLRNKLPAAQNNKSSKWETLARGKTNTAGHFHHALIIYTAIDYINSLEGQNKSTRIELDRQRDQMHQMELQLKELSARVNGGSFPQPPNSISQYNGGYSNGVDSEASRTLPPIMNGGAMQGVTYGENGR
ncbi:hypothetical protein OHC33_005818 [Knufia fluminis]|uniref:BHLH domain-containing protein n=1 Tax=Knufia fluminis TaxID=191047 RepID=A0AAN8EPK2_9EURO|nr:hypothetical protein OHC33_005818 [Knufia fluminis]